jgi:hypothetical protein
MPPVTLRLDLVPLPADRDRLRRSVQGLVDGDLPENDQVVLDLDPAQILAVQAILAARALGPEILEGAPAPGVGQPPVDGAPPRVPEWGHEAIPALGPQMLGWIREQAAAAQEGRNRQMNVAPIAAFSQAPPMPAVRQNFLVLLPEEEQLLIPTLIVGAEYVIRLAMQHTGDVYDWIAKAKKCNVSAQVEQRTAILDIIRLRGSAAALPATPGIAQVALPSGRHGAYRVLGIWTLGESVSALAASVDPFAARRVDPFSPETWGPQLLTEAGSTEIDDVVGRTFNLPLGANVHTCPTPPSRAHGEWVSFLCPAWNRAKRLLGPLKAQDTDDPAVRQTLALIRDIGAAEIGDVLDRFIEEALLRDGRCADTYRAGRREGKQRQAAYTDARAVVKKKETTH